MEHIRVSPMVFYCEFETTDEEFDGEPVYVYGGRSYGLARRLSLNVVELAQL